LNFFTLTLSVVKVKILLSNQVINTADGKEMKRESTILMFSIFTKYIKIEESTIKPIVPMIPNEISFFNVVVLFVQNQLYVDVQLNQE